MECKPLDRASILQNLQDAGCEPDVIERFLVLWDAGNTSDQLRLLSCYRCRLLDKIHQGQKQIDCLDYLIYHLKKCEEHKTNG